MEFGTSGAAKRAELLSLPQSEIRNLPYHLIALIVFCVSCRTGGDSGGTVSLDVRPNPSSPAIMSRFFSYRVPGAACALVALSTLAACKDSPSEPPPLPAPSTIRANPVTNGLSNPLFLTAPAGDPRLFIVEQPGRIRIFKGGQLLATPFLNVSSKITSGGERGLLGLAFHPQYATNGLFYVYYTDLQGNLMVERYHVSTNADVADASSGQTVITQAHPNFANHNGGNLLFGPDGMLYVGMGDGGSGGDPNGNGQNNATLLGKLLRIDVDHSDATKNYAIPSSNPFVNQGGARGEIWANGLRNPWRNAFDSESGLLYIADVGQGAWEEVNVVPTTRAGVNYGWVVMEGNHCYNGSSCNMTGLERPKLEYDHGQGCSITGGYVYRGSAIPDLRGTYFYSDYCSGWLRSFRYFNNAVIQEQTWDVGSLGSVLSFGQDSSGELYICSSNGTVYRIEPVVP